MQQIIRAAFEQHIDTAKATLMLMPQIETVSDKIIACLNAGNKILIFGNGGSAADAQHIAAEFVGRFVKNRRSLPAIALTTDSSAFTAIGNDYGFDRVFERQVEGLAQDGDILIGISTTGNSVNVIRAFNMGKLKGCYNIGLSGRNGGDMNTACDVNIIIPSDTTARIQEMHILIGHIICEAIDEVFE
ncbi:D-sedoheptulose 7-phosphate isomerase [Mucilaginibacter segetis]|uniref:Phosphoheptose isomerase n=1 Tax=Mucilaginibacter segetis TaxID=2793071 RepID=A0A934PW65_9SPHI|nr:D-sedoheptulose 7-phosphate isomerase [Mucilaginibacter segetis]MBK0381149.1 D-sedoheptulose 7-phosphate isomerase [Mucilaginibacter segetis]